MAGARITSTDPAGAPVPIRGYYSSCTRVEAGPLLFVSGQVSLDAEGNIVAPGDAAAQAAQALKNIETILASHGAGMAEVVKVTVFVTDIRYLDEIRDARLVYWPDGGPASSLVEVSNLAFPGLLVEIEAIAAPAA